MDYFAPKSKIKSLWAWFKRTYTMSETSPKQIFSVDGWKFSPMECFDLDGLFRHASGFVVGFQLEAGENSQHLRRSISSGRWAQERLVVLAADEDLAVGHALVRCLVVDVDTLRVSPNDPQHIAVQSADQTRNGGPRVYVEEQRSVPSDALWLVYPKQEASEPGEEWGSCYEFYTCDGTPTGPCADEDLAHARRAMRKHRRSIAFKTSSIAAGVYLYSLYVVHASAEDELSEEVWFYFGRLWLLMWFAIAIRVAVAVIAQRITTAHWFPEENGLRRDWKGGTLTAVWLGRQIKGRGEITVKDWRSYLEQEVGGVAGHGQGK